MWSVSGVPSGDTKVQDTIICDTQTVNPYMRYIGQIWFQHFGIFFFTRRSWILPPKNYVNLNLYKYFNY